jgi:hypothetical protein
MLSDLMNLHGKESGRQPALQKLIELDPKRPEPYRARAIWCGRPGKTRKQSISSAWLSNGGIAIRSCCETTAVFWNRRAPSNRISVLSELLSHDGERSDVRLELAEVQLRAQKATPALATLVPLRKVTRRNVAAK